METFQWNACFNTGLAEVDEQHHRLIDMINRLGILLMNQEAESVASQQAVFSELEDYTRYHFSEEEGLMEAMRLDPRYVALHRAAHASFLDEITQFRSGVSDNDCEAANASLLQFLTHWLAYHILGSDQFMSRQIAAIRSGLQPEAAYLNHPPSQDPATDILLSALNGLFHQVSDRNHELVQLNKCLEIRISERTQALTDANQRLDDLANTDTLSGLPNRRFAIRNLAMEWENSVSQGTPLACMMIDADGFKGINDTYGHDAGDAVLRALSKELLHAVRNDDIVCRLGGDEFLIICANTSLDGSMKLAEAIRQEVAALRVPAGAGEWVGSISVGVAHRSDGMNGPEDLMKAADQGLYVAKRNGRNCVGVLSKG
ncbi:MAG: bacteriohemerythrin [Betaproteobacteria bacterium]